MKLIGEQIEVLKTQHLSELESVRANLEAKNRDELQKLGSTLKSEYEKQIAQLKEQYEGEEEESDKSTSAGKIYLLLVIPIRNYY